MASIKLQGDTSGELTISAPAVAGTHTLTLPASTGTVLTDTAPKAGNILQVVQSTLDTAFTTTSQTFVDLLTVEITPSTTSSKIYVSFNTSSGTDGDATHLYQVLTRADTILLPAVSPGSRTGAMAVNNTTSGQMNNVGFSYLDTPATTAATTYKIRVRVGGAATGYWNRSARDTDYATYDGRTVTQITVMEVAA